MLFDCLLSFVTLLKFRDNHPSLTPLSFLQKHVTKSLYLCYNLDATKSIAKTNICSFCEILPIYCN